MNKPLGRLIKKMKGKHIRHERGASTTVPTDIKRKIRDYYEQLYNNKFNNLNWANSIKNTTYQK